MQNDSFVHSFSFQSGPAGSRLLSVSSMGSFRSLNRGRGRSKHGVCLVFVHACMQRRALLRGAAGWWRPHARGRPGAPTAAPACPRPLFGSGLAASRGTGGRTAVVSWPRHGRIPGSPFVPTPPRPPVGLCRGPPVRPLGRCPCPLVPLSACARGRCAEVAGSQPRLSPGPHGAPWAVPATAHGGAVMGRAGAGSADGRECSNRWALRAEAATPHARSCGGPASSWPDWTALRSPRDRESGRGDCGLSGVRRSGLRSLRSERAYGVRTLTVVRLLPAKRSAGTRTRDLQVPSLQP